MMVCAETNWNLRCAKKKEIVEKQWTEQIPMFLHQKHYSIHSKLPLVRKTNFPETLTFCLCWSTFSFCVMIWEIYIRNIHKNLPDLVERI